MILEVEDVHTYYGSSYILQGVSLGVSRSSIVALLGRNGMGKTTTVRSIMGLTPAARGSVCYRGQDVTRWPSHMISQAGIGLVAQGRRIFPSLTVEENLLVAHRQTSSGAPSWGLSEIFDVFPILRERRSQPGGVLSGGEQQMLAISRALMTNPDLLLLDEPSEGLSPAAVQMVREVIVRLKATGLSILLVEQNVSMALTISDYIYILSKGRVVHASRPQELRSDERLMRMHFGIEV